MRELQTHKKENSLQEKEKEKELCHLEKLLQTMEMTLGER